MASNTIPKNYETIVQMLEDAADGARDHGTEARLRQNTEADIRADLHALAGRPAGPGGTPPAIPGFKSLWNTAKTSKTASSAILRSKISDGKTLASACVNLLKLRLGTQWSSAWNAVGFPNGSLAIPENPMSLLQQIRSYFLAHPDQEVPALTPTVSATAAACEAAAQAISTAASQANQSNTDAGAAKKNLEDGVIAGKNRLSGLRAELSQTLPDDSPLWYAFGFQRPSDPKAPDIPAQVTATPGAPGSGLLIVNWSNARRAESYRATIRTTATPPAEAASRLIHDSGTTFPGLPPGSYRVFVTAINAAGESRESEPATATLA